MGEYPHHWNQKRLQIREFFSCFQDSQCILIQHWVKPNGVIFQTGSQGKKQSILMRKWESLTQWTPWCCPLTLRNHIHFFLNLKREQSPEIFKRLYRITVPWLQNNQSLKLCLEGKNIINTLVSETKKKDVTYIISQQKEQQDREEPHNHVHNILQTQ